MTPDQLKASILQLAIQGKLVPQRPEEGTAEELYKEIQREKRKLLAQGKIKKQKPLPPISEDEIPFDIPESWKWVRLGDVGYFVRGAGIKKTEVTQTGRPCVRYGQLYTTYKEVLESAISYVDESLYQKCKKAVFLDVLMALTGENKKDIATAVVYRGSEEIAIGGDMTKFTPIGAESNYLMWGINSPFGVTQKMLRATGDIIVHISNDKLASLLIPLPPLAEQQRIVAKIEQTLPLIERYGEAYTALETLDKRFPEDMRKSILQYAIQGKLVPQRPEEGSAEDLYKQIQQEKKKLIAAGKIKKEKPLPPITEDEIPFDIPEKWKWVRLGDVCGRFSTGPFGSMLHKSDYCELGIPVVNPTNIVDGKISACKVQRVSAETAARLSTFSLELDDIVLARRGNLSKSASVGCEEAGWLCGTGAFIVHPLEISPDWFCYFYTAPYVQSYLMADSVGTTMNNLNQTLLGKLPLPLPPLAEQKRIVAKIEQTHPLIERCGEAHAALENLHGMYR